MTLQETTIDAALQVHFQIPEFAPHYDKEYFEEVYKDTDKLILVAYKAEIPIGYILGYDRDFDDSFFVWMAGVIPLERRNGVLTKLMQYSEEWAKKKKYKKIRIKTRNYSTAMRVYVAKHSYEVIALEQYPDVSDNRITLEKSLM